MNSSQPTMTPTMAPTMLPTMIPTLAPTKSEYPVVSFNSSLALSGLPSLDLSNSDKLAIINATATSMGISSNNVEFVTLIAVNNNRRLALYYLTGSFDATAITKTTYVVTSGNSDTVYESLTNALKTAVESGSFTQTLQTVSVALGATTMASVNATGVTSSDPVIVYPAGSGDSGLSAGQIAGIVIGVVIGALIIIAIVGYLISRSRAKISSV